MPSQMSTPLAIIGAGPAGILAARTAAEAGVDVTIIDDNSLPGGQYYRQSPPEFHHSVSTDAVSGRLDGKAVLEKLNHPRIHAFFNTQVWGVFEDKTLAVAGPEKSYLLQVEQIILATGAYDRPLAFPGWTLPGILGAGAAMRMVKTQGVLPGKRIFLAGLGPLQLALADILLSYGATIVGIAEAANPFIHWQQLPKFWGHWDRLGEAYRYQSSLHKHHVPVFYGHSILEAAGQEQVKSARIVKLHRNGAPIPGTEKQFEVDAIALGYGLLPSIQLSVALDCDLQFDHNLQWFIPKHNSFMETTRPGIFVAGDMAGIGGSQVSLIEGQIAGLRAALQFGCIGETEFKKRSSAWCKELRRLQRLAGALQEIYAFRQGLNQLALDDTTICRCEEVTVGQVKRSIAEGARDLHLVKLNTRAGMGYCQSRFCSALIAPILSGETHQPVSQFKPFTVRPPVHPLPLKVLASGEVGIENS